MTPLSNSSVPTGGVPKVIPPNSVGDVTSTAIGSGARYNGGKPPMDLLPISVLADYRNGIKATKYSHCLMPLGEWQRTGKHIHLFYCLDVLGQDIWEEAARVFDYGRKKYAEWNWAKGMAWSIPLACAVRHLLAAHRGEDLDPESGLSHEGHAACNIIMLLTYMDTYPEGDDRPRYLVKRVNE
jgi:hypothetical protein